MEGRQAARGSAVRGIEKSYVTEMTGAQHMPRVQSRSGAERCCRTGPVPAHTFASRCVCDMPWLELRQAVKGVTGISSRVAVECGTQYQCAR
ncbi:hypothetical protein GCM10010264_45510 [Streptomyces globisporus]|nr:hypothetical protein GCM10010264_45510 [Streptomyces globisporus]